MPIVTKKRKKKTPLQKMHDKCWVAAVKVIKLRDYNQCQHCYKPAVGANGHCSHVIPKSVGGALRYCLTNLKLLCYHCHINWWHKNPMEAAEWFEDTFPDRWKFLKDHPRHRSYTIDELMDICDELKAEYERLNKNG